MLDALVASEGEPDLVQISGGEPTIHPEILDILRLAKSKPIRHVMLNTNGLRIASEPAFADALAEFKPGFEVYLQFDSLRPKALKTLRGVDLSRVRRNALEALERRGISTTLVVVVKRGVNDDEIGEIIDFARDWNCVRGVTFQPIQDAGRNAGFDKTRDRVVLSDVRKAIIAAGTPFTAADIIPLPCNPESIAIGYALRRGRALTPITSFFPKDKLIEAVPNAITFEKYPELHRQVFQFFSLATTQCNTPERLEALLCCLPEVPVPAGLGYENIFRVAVVEFLDRFNFCLGRVKRSCIHFLTPEGRSSRSTPTTSSIATTQSPGSAAACPSARRRWRRVMPKQRPPLTLGRRVAIAIGALLILFSGGCAVAVLAVLPHTAPGDIAAVFGIAAIGWLPGLVIVLTALYV